MKENNIKSFILKYGKNRGLILYTLGKLKKPNEDWIQVSINQMHLVLSEHLTKRQVFYTIHRMISEGLISMKKRNINDNVKYNIYKIEV